MSLSLEIDIDSAWSYGHPERSREVLPYIAINFIKTIFRSRLNIGELFQRTNQAQGSSFCLKKPYE
jgi:hypothetical protein